MSIDISIVIPTYNRSEKLADTLDSLASQQTSGIEYEVIFVNNGSTDRTPERLGEALKQYPGRFRCFHIEATGGPSAPRNVGIRNAAGQVVIILDDDVIPEPDLVQQHWAYHQKHPEPEAAAVGKVYVPDHLRSDPMSLFHDFPYHHMTPDALLSPLFFWTCNVSFKRAFMLEHGMFAEEMLYYEDVEVGYRLHNAGLALRFLPEARGQHLHKLKPEAIAEKGLFTGRWLVPLEQRIPDPAVKRRFGIVSRDIGVIPLARRLVNRAVFLAIDNPLTALSLRALGATKPKRTAVTDAYYYLLFRRTTLAGYRQAKRGDWKPPFDKRRPAVKPVEQVLCRESAGVEAPTGASRHHDWILKEVAN